MAVFPCAAWSHRGFCRFANDPPIIPKPHHGHHGPRHWGVDRARRRFGQLFRVYGGSSLREEKIVVVNGENGPQAEILTPGFHFWWLVNVICTVDTSPTEISIPADKVGVLVARDGAPLRPGQAFADPFPVELGLRMLER